MKKPLASVRILTYNHERYIKQCLDSIINQKTDFPFEIIIGEDCSTDNTEQIINRYQKNNPELIKIITSESNVGSYLNGMRSIRKCSGKYIANCDGDDYWLSPDKLQRQVDFLEANPDYGLVFGDTELIDSENNILQLDEYHLDRKQRYKSGEIFWDLLDKNFINMSSVCYLKESLNGIFPRNAEEELKLWFIVDYILWLHVAKKYKIKFIDEKLATYRSHDQNLTVGNDFLVKRNPIIIHKVCSGLNRKAIDTNRKKEIYVKKLISVAMNSYANWRLRLNSLWKLFWFPYTYTFLINKIFRSAEKNKFT